MISIKTIKKFFSRKKSTGLSINRNSNRNTTVKSASVIAKKRKADQESIDQLRVIQNVYSRQKYEEQLRKKYPAMQDAYEQYQTVLKLCEERDQRMSGTDSGPT